MKNGLNRSSRGQGILTFSAQYGPSSESKLEHTFPIMQLDVIFD